MLVFFNDICRGFPCSSAGKESTFNEGDLGSIPGLGRSPGGGKGYPLQDSGLENSMDSIVHGVTKSQIWLSNFHFHIIQQTDLINYSKIYNVDLKGTPALLLYTHHSMLLPIKVKGWQQDGKLLLSWWCQQSRQGEWTRAQRQGSGSLQALGNRYLRWFWLSLDGFRLEISDSRSIKFRVTYHSGHFIWYSSFHSPCLPSHEVF